MNVARHCQRTIKPETCKGLFVTDLDGTLLTDNLGLNRKDLETLSDLSSQHIVNVIATGRSYFSFNKLMQSLGCLSPDTPLAVDYVVFSTGAGIMDFPAGEIRKSFSLPHEQVVKVSAYLEDRGIDYMIQKPVPDTNHFIYSSHGEKNPDFHARIDLYGEFASPMTNQSLLYFGDATQLLCIVPQERGFEVANEIGQQFQDLSVIKATSPLDNKSIWIEIFSPGVSKSQAVRWLAEGLDLQSGDICAVGNDYNDEDLLHFAGSSFVTDNSPALLKKKFSTVGSNNNNGVSEAALYWLNDNVLQK